MNTKQLDKKYIANTYGRFDLHIVEGKGSLCYDDNGKEYIDLGSGIGVNAFGYSDKVWVDAVEEQLHKIQHTSNLYYTSPCARLAEIMCKKSGMQKVFFANSGAEANECAIKAAREWAAVEKGEEYYTIVTLVNSFHGRTVTTLAATGQDVFHEKFNPLTPGFVYAVANDKEDLREKVKNNKCAAIMFEFVQGEGGVVPLDKDFVEEIFNLAKEYNLLTIADEVQTGNGRLGDIYGYMKYGVNPDIVTTAKGLGGGLPIGAAMFNQKTMDVYKPGMHGSTFGGNPIAAAGAISIMERLTDDFMNEVNEKSQYIINALNGAKGIKSISGMGLMLGIETEKDAGEVIAKCMELGALPLKAKNKVRLLPPLNISMEEIKKAVEIIKTACM
ncbi:MAG: acetylornithine/succinylornithine family transaminase [Ruminococcaceae bacterium]|nr:acetylornithine/succinylornithine family transaminase [Oscillospiraceae bacterium]